MNKKPNWEADPAIEAVMESRWMRWVCTHKGLVALAIIGITVSWWLYSIHAAFSVAMLVITIGVCGCLAMLIATIYIAYFNPDLIEALFPWD